jgi:hypothetical protein
MNRGKNPKSSIPHSCVDFTIAALGTGATAPVIPADGDFRPATSTYPRRANAMDPVVVATRTSAGFYVIPFVHQIPNVLFATAVVLKAGASPTAQLSCDVTLVDPVLKQITVKCIIPNGTATDLGTNDMLVVYVHGQDSTK